MSDPWKADEPIKEENIINESERDSANPENDEYKLVKLESDGRLAVPFSPKWELIDSWSHSSNVTEVVLTFDGGKYTSILLIGNRVTLSANTSRRVQLSEDGGNTYITISTSNGGSVGDTYFPTAGTTSLERSFFVSVDMVYSDHLKPIHSLARGEYMAFSSAPVNALRFFVASGSITSGSLFLYGK